MGIRTITLAVLRLSRVLGGPSCSNIYLSMCRPRAPQSTHPQTSISKITLSSSCQTLAVVASALVAEVEEAVEEVAAVEAVEEVAAMAGQAVEEVAVEAVVAVAVAVVEVAVEAVEEVAVVVGVALPLSVRPKNGSTFRRDARQIKSVKLLRCTALRHVPGVLIRSR